MSYYRALKLLLISQPINSRKLKWFHPRIADKEQYSSLPQFDLYKILRTWFFICSEYLRKWYVSLAIDRHVLFSFWFFFFFLNKSWDWWGAEGRDKIRWRGNVKAMKRGLFWERPMGVRAICHGKKVELPLPSKWLSESYLAMVGIYVGHIILLILRIHTLATIIIPSVLYHHFQKLESPRW